MVYTVRINPQPLVSTGCERLLQAGQEFLRVSHFTMGLYSDPKCWYKDYFELKTFEIQQMQIKAFSELLLSD